MSCTLSDVITYVPFEPDNGETQSPHDCLNQLLNLISRLRGGASRYVPLLMAKVAESMPNMSNPLSHMPHTLDAFLDTPGSASSSPPDMMKQHSMSRQSQQAGSQQPMRSPGLPSPGMSHMHSSPFGENLQQAVQTPQQEQLMFEAYSPSGTGHADSPLSPLYGLSGPGQHLFSPPGSQFHAQPRSIPMSAPVKQEVWDGYRG